PEAHVKGLLGFNLIAFICKSNSAVFCAVLSLKIIVQMYKVFINDKPLFLTNKLQKETDFKYYLLDTVDLQKLIAQYFAGQVDCAHLYHEDEEAWLNSVKGGSTVHKADDGLVENEDGQVLYIMRTGKWHLAKGGIEKNETIEQTAVREVEEATNGKELEISANREKTYHDFKR